MEWDQEVKTYLLKMNNNSYILTMKIKQNEKIEFQLRPVNNFSNMYYSKEFNFEELIKQLLLSNDSYNNVTKIFKYYDSELLKNNISLIPSEKSIKLFQKKLIDSKEEEINLALDEIKLSIDEMLKMLYDDILEAKLKSINEEKIKIKQNEEMKKIINK